MRVEDESNTVHIGICQEAVHGLALMKFLKNCTFHRLDCRTTITVGFNKIRG